MAVGDRQKRIAFAQRVKREFESEFPELAKLRRQLIEAGMCKDSFSSVPYIHTERIHYDRDGIDDMCSLNAEQLERINSHGIKWNDGVEVPRSTPRKK